MRDQILAEIKRIADANGGQAPGLKTFESATGIRRHDWLGKFWSKWSDAVTEAGIKPLERTKKVERSFIFPRLAEIVRHYKREPTRVEFDLYKRTDSGLPWYQTLLEHFGSKMEMIAALRAWAETADGYGDIVAMLPAITEQPKNLTSAAPKEGYVYLIKSGAFYKIGRGDELEKRVKQIRVALPDSSTLEQYGQMTPLESSHTGIGDLMTSARTANGSSCHCRMWPHSSGVSINEVGFKNAGQCR
jgi:hypothetical protein